MALRRDKDGYLSVHLARKYVLVHRLVALTFIGPSHLPQVNHLNGVKSDNRLANLEWCSISDNVRHAIDTGLIVYGKDLNARRSKGWIQAEKSGFGLMLRGRQDLIAAGMNPSTVTSCLKGRRNTHRGFTITRVSPQNL
ncbi:HNH endonuclease [Pseudomonas simiae]|nr:HNH endonuclease [Pseudomonas simiae]